MRPDSETIAAVATPQGRGGIGIVRVSGPAAPFIATILLGRLPTPRLAQFSRFSDAAGDLIDHGLALYFPQPHSFTGEAVLELHGHGGPVVMDLLLQRVIELGARPAQPGEFSQRAFLNDKLDLAQAEAIADLIDASSAAAARLASRSLQGEFSRRVAVLAMAITRLRVYVEAAIDFPEDEIDFLSDSKVSTDLLAIQHDLEQVRASAQIGVLLRDGMYVVLAGRPNAGKSSLLNALAGRETAIVTATPGTTRDVLRERIQIDGMPLHLVDTAGLRDSVDDIEREGVRRARAELQQADRVLWVMDDELEDPHKAVERASLPQGIPLTLVRNKIDLSGRAPGTRQIDHGVEVSVSVRTGAGIEDLRRHLKASMGYQGPEQGEFMARRRHLAALDRAARNLDTGRIALERECAGELLAEDLRLAHQALSEITGEFTSDDLLGEIFTSFCIGK